MSHIRESLELLSAGQDLSPELARIIMEELLQGELTPAQVGALLLALRMKGESAIEIAAFAQSLRKVCQSIPASSGVMDTCGTGGDGGGTFNISTTAAFVVAGAGVPVAKHGNRFASGRCGSADVLEALGVPLNLSPEESLFNLESLGMAFLFAPLYHPALAKVATHRRELGVRTIFNLLGPLLNPAGATHQLLGVSSEEILSKMAEALRILGTTRSIVVVGEGGLDEVTLTGVTQAIKVEGDNLSAFTIIPETFGFNRCSLADLQGGSPVENANILLRILQGETGPKRDVVLLNAGVALYAAGHAEDLSSGIHQARVSLDSGQALAKLEQLSKRLPCVSGQ